MRHRTRARLGLSLLAAAAAAVVGLAELPSGAKPACPAGQAITGDTDGHCCWPGQAWKKSSARCVGVPRCPKGTTASGEACVGGAAKDGAGAGTGTDVRCPTGMALIKGGSFTPRGGAALDVDAFCLDRTEVTAAAYTDCVEEGACAAPQSGGSCNGGSEFWRNHPINCVDWKQASKYCAWAGRRLPSETEWEWAARGRDRASVYPWGDVLPEEEDSRQTVCWRQVTCRRAGGSEEHVRTCAVGSHRGGTTADGLEDMGGNVAEWTAGGSDDGRVTRGGSYYGGGGSLAVTARQEVPADSRKSFIGFRCALSLAAPAAADKKAPAHRKK